MWHHETCFEKTDAGRDALLGLQHATLARRERALLITVDGRSTYGDLCTRATTLGLDEDVVYKFSSIGLIRSVSATLSHSCAQDQPVEAPPIDIATPAPSTAHKAQKPQKRSLAAARMYLLDVIRRSFGPTGHPLHDRLLEATDREGIEGTFQALVEALSTVSSPSMVAHIEQSFTELLP